MAKTFTFILPDKLREALEKQAKKEDRSLSYLIVRYLRKGLIDSGYLQQENDE